ncbi:MAG: ABC transporter permease [Gemmatimonas sp.]
MSFLDAAKYRLRVWFNRAQHDREMDEERAFHLSLERMQQEHATRRRSNDIDTQNTARFAEPLATQFAAQRRFGNTTIIKEDTRTMAGLNAFDLIQQDLRFAWRSFWRTPGFTLVAALTLAIGIGANTAIFSAIDALLLRPLPFAEPERLMKLSLTRPAIEQNEAIPDMVWSYPKFAVLRDNQQVFTGTALFSDEEFTVRVGQDAERVPAETADGEYFRVLGLKPALGRSFVASEDSVVGGPKVITISHAYWQRRFNADPAVVGQSIGVRGEAFQIVGVWPKGFRGMSGKADIWMPILQYNPDALAEPYGHQFTLIARVKAGVTIAHAKAATLQLGAMVDRQFADARFKKDRPGAVARELDALRVDPSVRRSLLVLLGAVALVLLIACANVANLFLVRAAGRSREIAVRLAIGASRARLIRQLITESLLLSSIGGAVGIAFAWAGVRILSSLDAARALNVRDIGGIGAVSFASIELNLNALVVALTLSILTGLVFGLIPAWQSTRDSMAEELKSGKAKARHTVFRVIDSRNALAATEIALALVLLVGSGLMIRSLGQLLGVSPGFKPQGLLSMRFNVPEGSTRDMMPRFYEDIVTRLSALPGVAGVSLQDCPPLSGGCNGTFAVRRDRPETDKSGQADVGVHWIAPGWTTVMGVPLLQGRMFEATDRVGTQKVVLVSENAAKRLWPNEDAIGKPVSVYQGGFDRDTARVIGVVGNMSYSTIDAEPRPDFYLSHLQSARPRMMILVRTVGDPLSIAPAVRQTVQGVAPGVPLYDVRTMESRTADSTAYARFATLLLGLFAGVALLLAALGTYGVIAFNVTQRTREFGIRVALGASTQQVTRMVVGQGLAIASVGAVVGIAVALATSHVLQSMLYEVKPTDPATFASIVVILLLSVAAASWIPARRAARIQPTEALRQD